MQTHPGLATFTLFTWICMKSTDNVVAQTDKANQAEADKQTTITIAATVCTTVVVVVLVICIGCVAYHRIVRKIQRKLFMRGLIDCEHRSEHIKADCEAPDIDGYFKQHEAEVATLFRTRVTIDSNTSPKRKETIQKYGLDVDFVFSTDIVKDGLMSKLQAPRKVKQLYREKEMGDAISNDSYLDNVGQETVSLESSVIVCEKVADGISRDSRADLSKADELEVENEMNTGLTIVESVSTGANEDQSKGNTISELDINIDGDVRNEDKVNEDFARLPVLLSMPEVDQFFKGIKTRRKKKKSKRGRHRKPKGSVLPVSVLMARKSKAKNKRSEKTKDFHHNEELEMDEKLANKSAKKDLHLLKNKSKGEKPAHKADHGLSISAEPEAETEVTELSHLGNEFKMSKSQIAKEYDMKRRKCPSPETKIIAKKTKSSKSKTQVAKEYDEERRLHQKLRSVSDQQHMADRKSDGGRHRTYSGRSRSSSALAEHYTLAFRRKSSAFQSAPSYGSSVSVTDIGLNV